MTRYYLQQREDPHGPSISLFVGNLPTGLSFHGASCLKLMMPLVNDSLKFQMAILQIHCHLLLKKCENALHCKGFSKNVRILCIAKDSHIFSTKNNSVFALEVDI